jgi:hypothetical protein
VTSKIDNLGVKQLIKVSKYYDHFRINNLPNYSFFMKRLSPITGTSGNQKVLISKINQLITQNNEQKEEIRQIKQKLRVNAHFSHSN